MNVNNCDSRKTIQRHFGNRTDCDLFFFSYCRPQKEKGLFLLKDIMSLFPAYISLASTSNNDTQTTKTPSPTPLNQTGMHTKNANQINSEKIQKQNKIHGKVKTNTNSEPTRNTTYDFVFDRLFKINAKPWKKDHKEMNRE